MFSERNLVVIADSIGNELMRLGVLLNVKSTKVNNIIGQATTPEDAAFEVLKVPNTAKC